VTEQLRTLRKELGRDLKAARQAAGYSQMQLARKLGYSRSGVSNAESGGFAQRSFWERCDEVLQTGGTLAPGYDEIHQQSAAAQLERLGAPSGAPEDPGVRVVVGFTRGAWRIEIYLPAKQAPS
jgi:DNA-binding XRE family transcriptional regulator